MTYTSGTIYVVHDPVIAAWLELSIHADFTRFRRPKLRRKLARLARLWRKRYRSAGA